MTAIGFEVTGADADRHAAVPTIRFHLNVTETSGTPVHALALRCQIRIEPQRRHYSADEEGRLYELFGDTHRWGESLRPFAWTHTSLTIGAFDANTSVDLPVECTYDFEVTGAKYLHSLSDGEVPLLFLFSGTVFSHRGSSGSGLSVEPISWNCDASYRMPASVWRDVMDMYFPNSGWIRIHRDTLDGLQQYKASQALPTWDQALERLLKQAGEDL